MMFEISEVSEKAKTIGGERVEEDGCTALVPAHQKFEYFCPAL
jgi:hypothetical protein